MKYKQWFRVVFDKEKNSVHHYEKQLKGSEDYNGTAHRFMSFNVEWEDNDEGEVKVIRVEGFNS